MAVRAFLSYAWESTSHNQWVADLATRLRTDGIESILDQWALAPGDQLSRFMEDSVRESDFVLVVLSPKYKLRSDTRQGGVGYEGDIMTAEVFTGTSRRKFIPLLRVAPHSAAAPTWLLGSKYINFEGTPFLEDSYVALLDALHGRAGMPPPIGRRSQA